VGGHALVQAHFCGCPELPGRHRSTRHATRPGLGLQRRPHEPAHLRPHRLARPVARRRPTGRGDDTAGRVVILVLARIQQLDAGRGRPAVPVVSGGAHWGGGLFISAADLALIGQLNLDHGQAAGRQLLSPEWIDKSWTPCPVKAEYGYLWWLNDERIPWPTAPASGRSARGNGGRHLLWIDSARDLILSFHWTEDVADLLADVSATITPAST